MPKEKPRRDWCRAGLRAAAGLVRGKHPTGYLSVAPFSDLIRRILGVAPGARRFAVDIVQRVGGERNPAAVARAGRCW